MFIDGTLRGLALTHLDQLDCPALGPAEARDILDVVRATVTDLPWVTGTPVRLVLALGAAFVWMSTGSTLERLEPERRRQEYDRVRRLPLVAMADKLILNVVYLHALGAHPAAGETAP